MITDGIQEVLKLSIACGQSDFNPENRIYGTIGIHAPIVCGSRYVPSQDRSVDAPVIEPLARLPIGETNVHDISLG